MRIPVRIVVAALLLAVMFSARSNALLHVASYDKTLVVIPYDFDRDERLEAVCTSYIVDPPGRIKTIYGVVWWGVSVDWNYDDELELVVYHPDGLLEVYKGQQKLYEYPAPQGCRDIFYRSGCVYVCGEVICQSTRFSVPRVRGDLVGIPGYGVFYVYKSSSLKFVSAYSSFDAPSLLEEVYSAVYIDGDIYVAGVNSDKLLVIEKLSVDCLSNTSQCRPVYESFLVRPLDIKPFMYNGVLGFIVASEDSLHFVDPVNGKRVLVAVGRTVHLEPGRAVVVSSSGVTVVSSFGDVGIQVDPSGVMDVVLLEGYALVKRVDRLDVYSFDVPESVTVDIPDTVAAGEPFQVNVYAPEDVSVVIVTPDGVVHRPGDSVVIDKPGVYNVTIVVEGETWRYSIVHTVSVEGRELDVEVEPLNEPVPGREFSLRLSVADAEGAPLHSLVGCKVSAFNSTRTVYLDPGNATTVTLSFKVPVVAPLSTNVVVNCSGEMYKEKTVVFTVETVTVTPELVVTQLNNSGYKVSVVYMNETVPGELVIDGRIYSNPAIVFHVPSRIEFRPLENIAVEETVWESVSGVTETATTLPVIVVTKTVSPTEKFVVTVTETQTETTTITRSRSDPSYAFIGLLAGAGIVYVYNMVMSKSRSEQRQGDGYVEVEEI